METRKVIAYLLIFAVLAGIAVARLLILRARRRERRQAARPIEIVADSHDR